MWLASYTKTSSLSPSSSHPPLARSVSSGPHISLIPASLAMRSREDLTYGGDAMRGLQENVVDGADATTAGSYEAVNVGAAGEDGYVARLSSSGVTFAPCP